MLESRVCLVAFSTKKQKEVISCKKYGKISRV
nr:MAG TPA: hypothetical protein [Caudoviricetes sp.]